MKRKVICGAMLSILLISINVDDIKALENYSEPPNLLSINKSNKIGWEKVESDWYYINSDGTYKTGWLLEDGKWYYWNTYGDFYFNGIYKINGKNYNFDNNGVCTNPY